MVLGRAFFVVVILGALLAGCASANAGGQQTVNPATAAPATAVAQPAAPGDTATATAEVSAAAPAAATAGPTATAAATLAPTDAPAAAPTAPPTAAPTTAPTAAPAAAAGQPAAPACTPGALTPALTEGPYYKANPPQNSNLLQPGMTGTKLTLTGYVLDANCQPIAGARVDFWQANAQGVYDNTGYTLRGYQLTDAQGRYTLVTVVPGLYPGRTEHIHVKVTPPNGATLTTQLFFPGVAQNSQDGIFAQQNVLPVQQTADGLLATFNFVVKA